MAGIYKVGSQTAPAVTAGKNCAAICGENQYCSGIKLDKRLKVL